MERVVYALNEIDQKAEKIISAANTTKASMQAELNDKVAKFEKSLDDETQAKLDKLVKEHEASVLDRKATIDADLKTQLKAMEDNFNNNHDTLVNEVFNKIIEV